MSQDPRDSNARSGRQMGQKEGEERTRLNLPHVDQGPLNLGSISAGTSAGSITTGAASRSGRDAESRISSYSYRTDLDESRLFRQQGGRVFNAMNESYFLPSDEPEWIRLNKQYMGINLALGGLTPATEVVNAVLARQDGVERKVLDLGTGTGIWAIQMAQKYPHAMIIGVDLAPTPIEPANVPENCQFEIDDITLGLDHYWGQFDVVHARFIVGGLKNFRKTMNEIHQCLKPGGIMIWMEADYEWFSSDRYVYRTLGSDEHPDGSWIARCIFEMCRAASVVGKSDFAGMEEALDNGFWSDPFFDPDTCKTASIYVPVGPWRTHPDPSTEQRLKYIGSLIRQNLQEGHRGGQVIMRKAGWTADEVAEWSRKADEEMANMKPPVQARLRMAWGRRRAAPNQPAPPLPSLQPTQTSTSLQTPAPAPSIITTNPDDTTFDQGEDQDQFSGFGPYPYLYVYDTHEQAMADDRLRRRSKEGRYYPPLPT